MANYRLFSKTSKSLKTQLSLGVAITVGLVVCYEVHNYFKRLDISIHSARVLIAERNLIKGSALSLKDFSFIFADRILNERGERLITDQELHLIDGAILLEDLQKGQKLSWVLVHAVGKKGRLGERIPKGFRAYSFSVSSLIQVFPKDRVDVLFKPTGPEDSPLTLVEGALVLQVIRIRDQMEIVIAVAQNEIEILEKALSRGTLTVVLRNPDEVLSNGKARIHGGFLVKKRRRASIEVWKEEE